MSVQRGIATEQYEIGRVNLCDGDNGNHEQEKREKNRPTNYI